MTRAAKLWIDLDNTPHVVFFRPIIRELEARGHTVSVSARDAFQVCELADRCGMRVVKIGRHYGRNRMLKVLGLLWRSVQLLPFALRHRPDLALSHGSRSQILLSKLLRIPTVMIMDYEHAQTPLLLRPRWEIVPGALSAESLQCKAKERILSFEGIKEDVYSPDFVPDPKLAAELGLDSSRIIVTVRPPADEAHYHNPESDAPFEEVMRLVRADSHVQTVLLPRNKAQENRLRKKHPDWFEGRSVIVPAVAVDGLNLLWHSDLVVSGGGTMNREAAALGLPVYSIFRGAIGAVDRQLQRQGRLVMVESVAEVEKRVILRRRVQRPCSPAPIENQALATILEHIELILKAERGYSTPPSLRGAN